MRLEDIYALLKKIEAGQVSPSEIQEIREELQNKTEKNLLTYVDGKICTYSGEDVTFQEVYNMLLTEPDFVVLVYNDRAYHPNQVDADTIIFASTYTNAGHIVTYRILFNADESVTVSEVTAEKMADKVTEITDSNKEDTTKYTSVKAVTGYANSKVEINVRLQNNASKNLLNCSKIKERTINGVTFNPVFDNNGLLEYVNVKGNNETTNDIQYNLLSDYALKAGSYILNTGVNNTLCYADTYSLNNITKEYIHTKYSGWAELNVIKDNVIGITTRIIVNPTFGGELKIYPMIRRADIKDDTYEPYYPTNVELNNKINEIKSEIDSTLDNHCIDYYDEIIAYGSGVWVYHSIIIDSTLYKVGDKIRLYIDGDISYQLEEDSYCIEVRTRVNGAQYEVVGQTKARFESGQSLDIVIPDGCEMLEYRFYATRETSMSAQSTFRKLRFENETRVNQKIYIKENVNLIRNEDYIKLDTNKLDKSGGTITGTLNVTQPSGLRYIGIETNSSSSDRCIWFGRTNDNSIPVVNDNFQYNPGTDTLKVRNIQMGNATLQYDSTNNCLKFNFNNTSTASALSLEDEVIE
ncbi:MAG: hypothetical protein MJ230_01780 [bacterium]|nr:hypothetical protein [bacterium]